MTQTVSVVLPLLIEHDWQIIMTECAIRTLRHTTKLPFELIVVETLSGHFNPLGDRSAYLKTIGCVPDTYIKRLHKKNVTADINLGIKRAKGDYIVYTGNDVFVRPNWLEALWECWDIKDCGLATLASNDLKNTPVAQFFGQKKIIESIYGPFMMFRNSWIFDEQNFPCQFADSDLIMRIYESGLRMYRNCSVIIEHLNKQTLNTQENEKDLKRAGEKFKELHGNSNLLIYRVLNEGWII